MLDHLSAPRRPAVVEGEPGQTEMALRDVRTPAQRRADALAEMARLASGNVDSGVRAGEPARVVVHTSTEQFASARRDGGAAFLKAPGAASCEQTGPISPVTLARLACDAIIDRVILNANGRVLEMQSLGRLFTAAQRRALASQGRQVRLARLRPPCVVDGCPPRHLVDRRWTYHGRQRVLLCEAHHTTVHDGEWSIVMREGLPWFIPSLRIDPLRRPMRNTVTTPLPRTAAPDNRCTSGRPGGPGRQQLLEQ